MYTNFTRHIAYQYGSSCAKQMEYLTKEDIDLEPSQFFNNDRDNISLDEAINLIDSNKGSHSKSQASYYMLNVSPSYKELAHLDALAEEVVNSRTFQNEQDKIIAKDLTMKMYLQEYVNGVMANYAANFDRGISIDDLVYVSKIEQNRTYKEQDRDVKHNKEINKQILNNPKERAELEKQYKRNSEGRIICKGMQKEGLNYHAHIIVSRYEKGGKPKEKRSFSPLSKAKKTIGLNDSKVGFNRDAFNEKLQNQFDNQFNYERPVFEKYQYRKQEFKKHHVSDRTLEYTVVNNLKNSAKGMLKEAGIIPHQELPTSLKELQSKITNDLVKQLQAKEIKTIAKIVKNPKQVAIQKTIELIKTGVQGLDLGL